MLKDVRLYIAGKLVDCSEKLSLPITYQTEDFKNPTIVKNSFSKTITIPATANNNKIFGEIYKLDRLQQYGNNVVGINYNPSKRVDFQLFKDSELVESGYVQLNSVSTLNGDVKYNITLFGGLGDFFYGLKYNEDGSERTLADLQFFVNDETGNVLPKDDEFNFHINKEFVNKCFDKDWSTDNNQIEDFITFVPAYNGLYEDFDTSHCLVNTALNLRYPTSVEEQGVTYTTYNGYALASLETDYTEWQMRDLRSYKQRPAIKVSKLIETICRQENSGYEVVFDPNFFNSNNPYWNDAFVMLPLLGSEEEEETESLSSKLTQQDQITIGNQIKVDTTSFTTDSVFEVSDGYIDISNAPDLSVINVNVDIQLKFTPQDTSSDVWYPATYIAGFPGYGKGNSYTAQLLIYNTSDQIIGYSNLYNFTTNLYVWSEYSLTPSDWVNYTPTVANSPITNVYGQFKKIGDEYYFTSNDAAGTFRISLNNWTPTTNKIKVVLKMTNETSEAGNYSLYADPSYAIVDTTKTTNGYINEIFNTEFSSLSADWESKIITNYPVTKKVLLKTENSPADFLLSYSKLFGLYFVKDIERKTIRIYNRNGFFQKEIVNIEDRIDHSKDITINPILFDKKWYRMSLDTPETYFAKKYNKQYDLVYGQKRLDTGYNFNSEVTELYDSNVFENVITATDSDKYFRRFYNNSLLEMPCWLNDNATYTLYNQTDTELNEHNLDLYGANFINPNNTRDWSYKSGLDIYPKPCLFSFDGDEKSLEEISSALVFYNGRKELRDYAGSTIAFWLTDDLPEMLTLNEEACYLNTVLETDINGNRIAILKSSLPSFTSYKTNNNTVVESLDIGLPKEWYIDKLSYNEDATIYNKFWDSFYKDQFDVNTKKVTCFVKLDYANQEMLRKFYWFDNSIWILNKIDSFDINSNNTVRCEFIKVQDMNNYTAGVQDY